ncbi:hypothetical protein HID58_003331 [Brassica napus]|uniref:Uncharacterized protein n=1 Tax=Brassica napus TaxID=3708 RepID=A0ABQ8EPU2_BRANA|nr:hypothetical protein HID58_003331 [Brassica napus]
MSAKRVIHVYFLRKLKKVKKSNGQILAINEIFEKNQELRYLAALPEPNRVRPPTRKLKTTYKAPKPNLFM